MMMFLYLFFHQELDGWRKKRERLEREREREVEGIYVTVWKAQLYLCGVLQPKGIQGANPNIFLNLQPLIIYSDMYQSQSNSYIYIYTIVYKIQIQILSNQS